MIRPFEPKQVKRGNIGYGLSCVGYDCRIGTHIKQLIGGVLDPKRPELAEWREHTLQVGDYYEMQPGDFVLAATIERFDLPTTIATTFLGKSTLVRCAVFPLVTPAEPGWRGYLTLELANLSRFPARFYAGEGIGQMLFWQLDSEPALPYGANGTASYQDQAEGPQTARHQR